MTDHSDSERQPLLPDHRDISHYAFRSDDRHRRRVVVVSKRRSVSPVVVVMIPCILLLVSVAIILFLFRLRDDFSLTTQIQDDIRTISSLHIDNLHIDGWKKYESDTELADDGGKYLQVSSDVHMAFNYDLLNINNGNSPYEPVIRPQWFSFISQNLVRSLCVGIDNAEIYDGPKAPGSSIGRLRLTEPLCFSLTNGTMNDMRATVLLQPHMNNIWSLIKKLWNKNNSLDLWLDLDVTLYKPVLSSGTRVKISEIHNLRLDWDTQAPRRGLIDFWSDLQDYLRLNSYEFESFTVRDIENGFGVSVESKPLNALQSFIQRRFPWLELIDLPLEVPAMEWSIKLPDCTGNLSIDIPSLTSRTETFLLFDPNNVSEAGGRRRIILNNEIVAPLPDSLIRHICPLDNDDNKASNETPLTKLIHAVLDINSTSPITFRVEKAHALETGVDSSATLWGSILNNFFLPIDLSSPAIKYNVSKLIKKVQINDMRLTRLSSYNDPLKSVDLNYRAERLGVSGSITVIFDLGFYRPTTPPGEPHGGDQVKINRIGGTLDVYHRSKHMLSVHLQTWTNSTSRLCYSPETKTTLMEVQFDMNDSEVTVIDRLELTRCGNEILFRGNSKVSFNGTVDFIVDSVLGSFPVTDVDLKGDTLIT